MTQEAGQMSSPGHPGLYPNNFNCEWEIRGPEGSTIDVQITVLSIENPRQVYLGRLSLTSIS